MRRLVLSGATAAVIAAGWIAAAPVGATGPARTSSPSTGAATTRFTLAERTPTRALSVEIPPPVVVTAPPPPTAPTTQARRSSARRSSARRSAAATLPNTGPKLSNTESGTLPVALAGLGALAIGGLALWWGGRTRPAANRRAVSR